MTIRAAKRGTKRENALEPLSPSVRARRFYLRNPPPPLFQRGGTRKDVQTGRLARPQLAKSRELCLYVEAFRDARTKLVGIFNILLGWIMGIQRYVGGAEVRRPDVAFLFPNSQIDGEGKLFLL